MRTLEMSLPRMFSAVLLALLLAVPMVASAGGLCLEDTTGRQYVLNKVSPKIKAAKAKPFGGVSVFAGFVRPLTGVATKNSDASVLSLAFTVYEADVNSGGGFALSGTSLFHQVAFNTGGDAWDLGEAGSSCYWEGGFGAIAPSCTTMTAIDCASVVIP